MFIYIECKNQQLFNRVSQISINSLRKELFNHSGFLQSKGILFSSNNSSYLSKNAELIYWQRNSELPGNLSNDLIAKVESEKDLIRILKCNQGWDSLIFYSRKLNGIYVVQNHIAYPDIFYINNHRYLIATDTLELIYKCGIADHFTVNQKALDQYLYQYFILKTQCVFKEVKKVQPAQMLTLSNNTIIKSFYWKLNFKKTHRNYTVAVNEWDNLISESIRKRGKSIDNINLFLSGGIDSGLLTHYSKKHFPFKRINCYTTKLKDSRFDESTLATITANHLDVNHFKGSVKKNILEYLPEIVWYCQEPYADRSMLAMYQLGQQFDNLKNIISGDAEGHGRQFAYQHWLSSGYRNTIPRLLRLQIPRFADVLKSFSDNKHTRKLKSLSRFGHPDIRNIFYDGGTFNLFEIEKLSGFKPDINDVIGTSIINDVFCHNSLSDVDWLIIIGIYSYCYSDYPKRLEVFQKRFNCGVELPFLDKSILQYIISIPDYIKFQKNDRKPLTRGVAKKYLPDEVVFAKKSGWYIPAVDWLFYYYGSLVRRYLINDLGNRGIFDRKILKDMVEKFLTNRSNGYKIWMLLVLELWFKMFIDRSISKNDFLSDI